LKRDTSYKKDIGKIRNNVQEQRERHR